jgi:hypothetical protein
MSQTSFYVIAALLGFVLATVLKAFRRASATASQVAVPEEATVLRQGPANFKRGWVMVGGALKLTPEHLVFSSHGFAQKAQVHAWELRGLKGLDTANTLGIVPNAIVVRFEQGQVKLVVNDRKAWLLAIRSAVSQLRLRA